MGRQDMDDEITKLVVGLRQRRSPTIHREALSEAYSRGLLEYDDGGFALTSEGEAVADAAIAAAASRRHASNSPRSRPSAAFKAASRSILVGTTAAFASSSRGSPYVSKTRRR